MFVTLLTLICCAVSPASAEHNIVRLAKEVNESMSGLIRSTSASLDDNTHLDKLGAALLELVTDYASDAAVEVTELDVGPGFDGLLAREARMFVDVFEKFAPTNFWESSGVREQMNTIGGFVQIGSAALRYISYVPFDKAHRLAGNESSVIKTLCQNQLTLLEASVKSFGNELCNWCPDMRQPLRSSNAYLQLAQIAQFTAYVACGRFNMALREKQIGREFLLRTLHDLRKTINDCCKERERPVQFQNQPFCPKQSSVLASKATSESAHVVISANETSQELRVHHVAQSFSSLPNVSIASAAESLETYILKSAPNKRLVFMAGQSNYPLAAPTQQIGNAFIGAVVTAWSNHYSLELSPDDFWTAILQGVAQYLSRKDVAEKYRSRIVEHTGKKTLSVLVDESALNGAITNEQAADLWCRAIVEFGHQIRNNTKGDIAEATMKKFTSTGAVEDTVFSASLMMAMQNYFDYHAIPLCGIPALRLWGTVGDYQDIIDRIDRLLALFEELFLSSWLRRIRSDMSRVLEIRSGNITSEHVTWLQQIVQEKEERYDTGCVGILGWHEVTGWIGDFILGCHPLDECEVVADLAIDQVWGTPAITLADVELMSLSGAKLADMKVAAGFVGISQNRESKAIRPALGWMLFNASSDAVSTTGQ